MILASAPTCRIGTTVLTSSHGRPAPDRAPALRSGAQPLRGGDSRVASLRSSGGPPPSPPVSPWPALPDRIAARARRRLAPPRAM